MKSPSLMRLSWVLTFLIPFFLCHAANGESINDFFQTVAFLHGKGEVEHAPIDGVDHEIWLRAPSEAHPHPYRKTNFGTGFFVRKGTQIYLITAEHVARILKDDVKVTVHGSENRPLTYSMKDLTEPGKDHTWFFHSEADVALLQIKLSQEFKGIIRVLEPNLLLASENEFGQYVNRVLTTLGFPLALGLSEDSRPSLNPQRRQVVSFATKGPIRTLKPRS
jgi:hypothetical protein